MGQVFDGDQSGSYLGSYERCCCSLLVAAAHGETAGARAGACRPVELGISGAEMMLCHCLPTASVNAFAWTSAQDAARLAMKVVATYGLSDAGITVYAPPPEPPGFGRKSFEVAIDNIDADLFGRAARVRRLPLVHRAHSLAAVPLGAAPPCSFSTRW